MTGYKTGAMADDTFWRVAMKNVNCKSLNASGRDMQLLPSLISVRFLKVKGSLRTQSFSNLTKLTLSHNKFRSLPDEIAVLTKVSSCMQTFMLICSSVGGVASG